MWMLLHILTSGTLAEQTPAAHLLLHHELLQRMMRRVQPAPLPAPKQKRQLSAEEQRKAVDALRKELGLSGGCQ